MYISFLQPSERMTAQDWVTIICFSRRVYIRNMDLPETQGQLFIFRLKQIAYWKCGSAQEAALLRQKEKIKRQLTWVKLWPVNSYKTEQQKEATLFFFDWTMEGVRNRCQTWCLRNICERCYLKKKKKNFPLPCVIMFTHACGHTIHSPFLTSQTRVLCGRDVNSGCHHMRSGS